MSKFEKRKESGKITAYAIMNEEGNYIDEAGYGSKDIMILHSLHNISSRDEITFFETADDAQIAIDNEFDEPENHSVVMVNFSYEVFEVVPSKQKADPFDTYTVAGRTIRRGTSRLERMEVNDHGEDIPLDLKDDEFLGDGC